MKFSDFLRWGPKKNGADSAEAAVKDRRQTPRRPTNGGGWIYWATGTGQAKRTRVTFLDVSDNAVGLGFVSASPPADDSICWALPDGGKPLACAVRHKEKAEQGYRVGASLDFEARFAEGRGASRVQWAADGVVHSFPATVKNSGQGLIEINLPSNIPARQMIFLEGPNYGCLAVCRGSRPDGSRFILVAEAASDAFTTAAAA